MSIDPVGFAVGGPGYFNRYAYVQNDPVNATDPTGELIFLVIPVVAYAGTAGGVSAGTFLVAAAAATVATVAAVVVADAVLNESDDSSSSSNGSEAAKPREKAKDRRRRQRREANEEKHGDPDYVEPASEDYAKWKAREAEKRGGKEERRRGHDEKQDGEGDRTKEQIDEDYDPQNN